LVAQTSDRWKVRRYRDDEVLGFFGSDRILEIHGAKGTGFAEDTLCIHKGLPSTRNARLLLQFQYALYDYRIQRDEIEPAQLKRVL